MIYRTILVSGGAGFLGSHFVKHTLDNDVEAVINVDALTYAGDIRRLEFTKGNSRHRFFELNILNSPAVAELFSSERPEVIVHYAADSHVTRSESDPTRFHRTNVEGTRTLIQAAIENGVQRFVHISTDEVYGPIASGYFREEDKIDGDSQASSPYAKSKSLADDLVRSYAGQIDVVIARPTNAFGPWQYPEKAFSRWITRGLRGEPLLVWGDGLYVRQWLDAKDFARAIDLLIREGKSGEAYNVGPSHDPEITNLQLARWTAHYLELPESQVELTEYDRPDHDRRYAVDASKIRALGWAPGDVWKQLAETVEWYRNNEDCWNPHIEEAESIYSDSK